MPTKEEINKVAEIGFWKERLENAKKKGALHTSVYETSAQDFQHITDVHKLFIGECVEYGDKVLDIGCGYGRFAPDLNPEFYTGIDFSPDFIEEAKKNYPGYKFIVGDIRKMPFKDGEFDWGIAVSIKHMIIHYLGEEAWAPFEKEIKRVCKKTLILEYTKPSTNYEIL